VLGALATGIGLYGISRIYGSVGTINFKEVGEIMSINGIDEMNL
jgi:NADH:ubiquinone oxidoreductase subunit 2 (subunit N)